MDASGRASYRVLVVDDEPAVRQVLAGLLSDFCHVSLASTGEEALVSLSKNKVDLLLVSDVLQGTLSRAQLIREVESFEADLPVFVFTQKANSLERSPSSRSTRYFAVQMLRSEAGRARLLVQIDRAVDERVRRCEAAFRQRRDERVALSQGQFLVGDSAATAALREEVARAAQSALNVLLTGETGVGKSLVAEGVHRSTQGRADRPFVVTEPATLPATLFEAELFGHARGAFTGATSSQVGAFEAAEGGTLFLDEIGELGQPLQVKLLRAVETKVIRRLGDPREIKLDVRVVTATNRDIEGDVMAGRFRGDLYHRLNEISLYIPPLRERREDIVPLLKHFLGRFAPEQAEGIEFQTEATRILIEYAWPGNVREVRTLARRLAERELTQVVSESTLAGLFPARLERAPDPDLSPEDRVRLFRRRVYLEELSRSDFNIRDTARRLAIPYATLHSRLKSLELLDAVKERKGAD